MYSRIQIRRDTYTNWVNSTDTPLEGEICLTLDGEDAGKFKIGDGVQEWVHLEYYAGDGGAQVIVGKDDPYAADDTLPEGTLWFPFDKLAPEKEASLMVLCQVAGSSILSGSDLTLMSIFSWRRSLMSRTLQQFQHQKKEISGIRPTSLTYLFSTMVGGCLLSASRIICICR